MNPFLADANTRIAEWRKLRDSIATLPLEEQLKQIAKWWAQCPIENWVIDSENTSEWPKPWELLSDNHYCNTTIAYLMAQTLVLVHDDPPPFNIKLWYIQTDSDQWMCLVVDNKWLLNYSHSEVVNVVPLQKEFTVKYAYEYVDGRFIPA